MRDGKRVPFISLNVGDEVTLHECDGSLVRDGSSPFVRVTGWPTYDAVRRITIIDTIPVKL